MRQQQSGFALPTILIASVIMLIVLVSAVTATSSVRTALDSQYYTKLAQEASESGIARANDCLAANAYIAQWSDANPLRPNTSCSGGAACTNTASCFVMNNSKVRSTFSVDATKNVKSSQIVTATGTVQLLRTSNGAPWRTYTYQTSGRVGADLSLSTVAFGYDGPNSGVYFATIAADSKMRAVGYNGSGQLGNGTFTNTLTPTNYQLNSGLRVSKIFTNFVSQGYSVFVLTTDGNIYGSGLNDAGQLGDGTTTNRSIPVRYGLPSGVKGVSVGVGGHTTFVVGDDNKLYATGDCSSGMLGTNYTISGCSNRTTPQVVPLPAGEVPTSDIAIDGLSAYVRTQSGKVYGWGDANYYMLGQGDMNDSSAPVQVGTFGNTGQPKATQLAFDGNTVYILDNTGKVSAVGRNTYGEADTDTISLMLNGKCFQAVGTSGVQLATCNKSSAAQQWAWRSDQSLYNPASGKCLDNVTSNGHDMQIYTCNQTGAQRYVMEDSTIIRNVGSNNCLNNSHSDQVTLILYATCSPTVNEAITMQNVSSIGTVQIPSSAGTVTKIATDQWFMAALTSSGQVWSVGYNNKGQLGNGAVNTYQPYPVQFNLPSGVTATDIWTSGYPATNMVANIFVVGSNGKVYGAGDNRYGQLGDGTTTNRSTPVAMQVIDGDTIRAKQVQSGYGTTVVLTTDGRVYTVGNNSNGQLGDGTTTNSTTPKANRYTNVLPVTIF